MKNFDHIKEPTKEEFYDRCNNIEQEKKDRLREQTRKTLESKVGAPITEEKLDGYIKSQSQKIIEELKQRCAKK